MTTTNSVEGLPDTLSDDATPVPFEADPVSPDPLAALDRTAEEAGGPYSLPPEFHGSIGRTLFDSPSSADGTITVILPKDNIDKVPSQSMLRIRSKDRKVYVAVVTAGPFAEPDGMRADSPSLVVSAVNDSIFLPNYHGRVQVEVLGEETHGSLTTPRHRPLPNSPVFPVPDDEMTHLLRSKGAVRLGVATGHPEVQIRVPVDDKSVLPRHVGVLGTTGGGKTTTVANMIGELQQADAAVILFDTEGEYTTLNEAGDDPAMLAARTARGLALYGIPNTAVYHLVGRDAANPAHPQRREFGLKFSTLSPWALKEILDLSDAQETRFLAAYDVTKAVLRQLGIFPVPKSQADERRALEVDELEEGWPSMTLPHLLYVAGGMTNKSNGSTEEPWMRTPPEFQGRWDDIKRMIAQAAPKNQISWRALMARLYRLHRLGIFDQPGVAEPDYSAMLKSGNVTVVDLSDLDSPAIRNLAIAQILQSLQRHRDESYSRASEAGVSLPLAMILIEEAHEFLSAERIRQMPVLFQQVARLARRGRKRWLGLGFITQLPQHLPDEVLALINNWVLHKIHDVNVINRLRRVIPGVDEAMWRSMPAQPPGEAIVSFTHLKRPVTVSMDASPCRLRMVE